MLPTLMAARKFRLNPDGCNPQPFTTATLGAEDAAQPQCYRRR
jgi:hypothetical protein